MRGHAPDVLGLSASLMGVALAMLVWWAWAGKGRTIEAAKAERDVPKGKSAEAAEAEAGDPKRAGDRAVDGTGDLRDADGGRHDGAGEPSGAGRQPP